MNQYINQFKKTSIETASREQILIILFDGAIQFLHKAKMAMQNNQIEETNNNLIGAQKILQEFINSMNKEIAPQLAQNLISLYEYYIRRLIHANIKKEIEPIDEVLGHLKSLKATFEKAIVLSQKEQIEEAKRLSNSNEEEEEEEEDDDEDDDDDYDKDDKGYCV